MLTALLPAASAAKPDDLRHVVAAQAKAIAGAEWKSEARIQRTNHSDYKKTAMHNAGALPTTYFEYSRQPIPYQGIIMDETSASYEQFLAQLTEDGFLPEDPYATHYGMNADAFLVDVVSRVSPTPINSVKQAISSGAVPPLLSGVDLTASSSKLAASDTKALVNAYGKLTTGDLLIAWDDNAEQNVEPAKHVLVVSGVEVDGTIYITYPAWAQATFHFTCDKCGAKSTEGPTSAVLAKHMVSKNYQFDSFATHSAVVPSSGCSGTWRPDGGSTWRTERMSLEKLSGAADFEGGGDCYIPFTLPVYTDGAPEVKVTFDTQTTKDTLVAGLSGTITSNYRIVQVDAILSTDGKPDQVFTHYPDYDAWTYEFSDDALNRAMVASSTGNCTVKLNVHSGPVYDSATLVDPVTTVFDVSVFLSDPSFTLSTTVKTAHQGQSVPVSIVPAEEGITATKMEMTYDRDTYYFDMAKTRSANKNITFTENADGSVGISYSGAALTKGSPMATLYFAPHRTGDFPISADKTGIFAVRSAWKDTASTPNMIPTRVGGEAVSFNIGYNLKVYENYAGGKSMIIFGSEATPVKATYGDQKMVEVTLANYQLDGMGFTHLYAIVVDEVDLDQVTAEKIESSVANVWPGLLYYDCDVNRNGSVDIADAQAAANIMAGRMPLEGNQEKWLVADTDANGKVDADDILAILAAANK